MIQFEESKIQEIVLHRITSEVETSVFADAPITFADKIEEYILKKIFLHPFLTHTDTSEFDHEIRIDLNVLFNLSRRIYQNEDFMDTSRQIARHLIASSQHPKIKDGDLFIVKFKYLVVGNSYFEGLGLFKFKYKDDFLETSWNENNQVDLSFRKGIGNKKPSKSCLIIFTDEPYTILIVEGKNDTDYWQQDFIKHRPKHDHINQTKDFLALTKTYVTTQISNEFEVTKADEIDLLNRSIDYFKQHDKFDKQEFEAEVLGESQVIESFRKFEASYKQEGGPDLSDNFDISSIVVKKQSKVFNPVLKLDNNFQIQILGSRELIEQGVDADGRKYYKLYYERES